MPTATWRQKQEEAKALVEQVKADNKAGIENAEKASELTNKMAEAQRLMAEVREERLTEEKAALEALLEQHDKESAAFAPQGGGPLVATRPAVDSAAFTGMMSANPRLTMSRAAVDTLAVIKAALGEGVPGSGGFLVPPQYMQNLFAETRRQGNALRRLGLLAEHPVESNQVLLPRGTGSATVGVVAENTTKPSADQTYTQVTVNIFVWAGISKIAKQLAMDSSPTAADLVARELGTLLGNLEEQKIYSGSGTGEPRGILNTTGTGTTTAVAGGATQQAVIDTILDAVVSIQTNYFAPPTAIAMAPRRLAWLLKGKDTQTNYIFNPGGSYRGPEFGPALGVTSMSEGTNQAPVSLFGIPIAVSANIPTNLGAGTNQDVIIVGAWQEAHWFQRQDITMDVSDTAGTAFEQNQLWYRLEERAGFSAERYPAAFAIVSGAALLQT